LGVIGALLRLLPERDPHENLYVLLMALIEGLDDPLATPPALARFEARMLEECGFALDFSECAATGATHDLVYVSPKSARAVSRAAGEPYRDRLLPLPAFLRDEAAPADAADIAAAFRLTGFFLERELFGPRGQKLPDAREAFLNAMRRAARADGISS
jgi:DNA repair protein RecO (recombination protein O)